MKPLRKRALSHELAIELVRYVVHGCCTCAASTTSAPRPPEDEAREIVCAELAERFLLANWPAHGVLARRVIVSRKL